jgi:hypothetical protein
MLRKVTLVGICGFLWAVSVCALCVGVSSYSCAEVQGIPGVLATLQPGPQAIPLKVWSDKEPGASFQEGERIVITFQAAQPAYLTILSCSSTGDVVILFPNKEHSDNFIERERPYNLFGDDSTLRLSVGREYVRGGLILCLSPKPISLDSLQAPEHQWLTIPANANKQIETLRTMVQNMAKDPGFNKVLVPIPGSRRENREVIVSVAPDQGRATRPKGLPGAVESSEPEVVTGSAGFKPVK